jgi:hypothetical protein
VVSTIRVIVIDLFCIELKAGSLCEISPFSLSHSTQPDAFSLLQRSLVDTESKTEAKVKMHAQAFECVFLTDLNITHFCLLIAFSVRSQN